MNKLGKIIPRGPFKSKRIELASTEELDMFRSLAEEFMEAIFCMEPGSYLITDESSLGISKGSRSWSYQISTGGFGKSMVSMCPT
jgi:hypothetical protein